ARAIAPFHKRAHRLSSLAARGFSTCYCISVDARTPFTKPFDRLWAHPPKPSPTATTPFKASPRKAPPPSFRSLAWTFASKHLQHRLRAGNPQCIRGGFHAVFGLLNFFVGCFHGQRRRVCSQLGLHHSALRPRVGNRHSVIIFMNHLPHTPTNACRRW